ncbi:hypothetical protein CEUSTIGMA_g3999.t1 [Chlamydomonas eustigma]|uniref:Uncharacterized protein n=1 Tax=Chlamydomonas eustigma TaxID=1157962 RepID=A0A250X0E7_9CHLO|nr:hypothetical protein CEUSTIGMA_g3999.t1 [Chlamydomonas eustigma]|eukprot:GAX76553.1 hypothetical protein CEUSTIGMA_g3999.t1 [Chlamydomonas eustigma]
MPHFFHAVPSSHQNRLLILILTFLFMCTIFSEWYLLTSKLRRLQEDFIFMENTTLRLEKEVSVYGKLVKDQTDSHDLEFKALSDKVFRIESQLERAMDGNIKLESTISNLDSKIKGFSLSAANAHDAEDKATKELQIHLNELKQGLLKTEEAQHLMKASLSSIQTSFQGKKDLSQLEVQIRLQKEDIDRLRILVQSEHEQLASLLSKQSASVAMLLSGNKLDKQSATEAMLMSGNKLDLVAPGGAGDERKTGSATDMMMSKTASSGSSITSTNSTSAFTISAPKPSPTPGIDSIVDLAAADTSKYVIQGEAIFLNPAVLSSGSTLHQDSKSQAEGSSITSALKAGSLESAVERRGGGMRPSAVATNEETGKPYDAGAIKQGVKGEAPKSTVNVDTMFTEDELEKIHDLIVDTNSGDAVMDSASHKMTLKASSFSSSSTATTNSTSAFTISAPKQSSSPGVVTMAQSADDAASKYGIQKDAVKDQDGTVDGYYQSLRKAGTADTSMQGKRIVLPLPHISEDTAGHRSSSIHDDGTTVAAASIDNNIGGGTHRSVDWKESKESGDGGLAQAGAVGVKMETGGGGLQGSGELKLVSIPVVGNNVVSAVDDLAGLDKEEVDVGQDEAQGEEGRIHIKIAENKANNAAGDEQQQQQQHNAAGDEQEQQQQHNAAGDEQQGSTSESSSTVREGESSSIGDQKQSAGMVLPIVESAEQHEVIASSGGVGLQKAPTSPSSSISSNNNGSRKQGGTWKMSATDSSANSKGIHSGGGGGGGHANQTGSGLLTME